MKYLSICSGIEAASAAWHGLGWQPVGFSEIEPFPSAVLAHRFPDVPNYGDMTNFKQWGIERGTVELLVGGTPCQAFSVAGLRKGLGDARGNLTLTFCEIADHFDPEVVVWENVPGVLSSKDNAFGCFLAGLVGADEPIVPVGKWESSGVVSGPKRTAAWRILDAQYFGVAQRRRRVFVLAFRGAGNWRAAAALFPVGESVHGDTAPRREKGKDFTHDLAPCLTSSGRGVGRTGDTRGQDPVVAVGGIGYAPEIARCVATREGSSQDWETTTMVVHGTQDPCVGDVAFALGRNHGQENAVCVTGDVTHTLRAEGFDASEDGTGRGQPIVAAFKGGQGVKAGGIGYSEHVAPTLSSADSGTNRTPALLQGMAVRRLTPVECERLQGFPDGWTAAPYRGKPAADGPRYKALGNSMAVPVMRWLGRRIQTVKQLMPMGEAA